MAEPLDDQFSDEVIERRGLDHPEESFDAIQSSTQQFSCEFASGRSWTNTSTQRSDIATSHPRPI